jgi:hypothetical protein
VSADEGWQGKKMVRIIKCQSRKYAFHRMTEFQNLLASIKVESAAASC